MAFDVMGVIQGEVFGPVRARFRQFQNGSNGRVILRQQFRRSNYFDLCAFRQLYLWRQDHHAVLDCAFETHAYLLTPIFGQSKPVASRRSALLPAVLPKLPGHAGLKLPP